MLNKQILKQFIRYLIVGSSSFILDISLLYLLTEIVGLRPTFSLVFSQIIVIIYNFSLNRFWTFKSTGQLNKQMILYLLLVVFNYFLGLLIMYIGNEIFKINYLLIRVVNIALITLWNFLIYKYIIYKDKNN